MGMARFFGRAAAVALLAFALSSPVGCGQSNDQGISFRALGFFMEAIAQGTTTPGDAGRIASLQEEDAIPNNIDEDPERDGCFLGIENNLIQGIRVDRVDIDHRVTGTRLAIPSDAFALTFRLGPSSGQEPNNPPVASAQIFVVTPQIFEFLNQNRSLLPKPPFTLVSTVRAVGVADSGDVFVTNPVSYETILVDLPPGTFNPLPNDPTVLPTPTVAPTPITAF